jgi:hypothetical protein
MAHNAQTIRSRSADIFKFILSFRLDDIPSEVKQNNTATGYIHNLLTSVVEFDAMAVPIYKFPAGGDLADNQNSIVEFRRTMFDLLEKEEARKPTACGTRGTPPLCDCRSAASTVTIVDCQFL